MAAANRRPKAILVKKESVDQANSFLGTLPEKTREEFSLREAVNRLQQPIRNALAKGYSYEEIAGILAEQGVTISSSTLKNYVPAGGRRGTQDKTSGTQNRRGKAHADETTVAEPETADDEEDDEDDAIEPDQSAQVEEPEEPEEPEAEAKPRGRRPRTTSTANSAKSTTRKPASTRTDKTTTTRRRRKSSTAE
jgi:hypothetical protein